MSKQKRPHIVTTVLAVLVGGFLTLGTTGCVACEKEAATAKSADVLNADMPAESVQVVAVRRAD